MSVEIKALHPEDVTQFINLISLFSEVFEMHDFKKPSFDHLQKLLAKENFFAVTAMSESVVVGGLTIYVLDQCYSTKPLAYIYDLAVAVSAQRHGIGTKLIEFAKDYCRQKGFEELFVQAETIDDYAVQFYRSTGITAEEEVRHFSYRL